MGNPLEMAWQLKWAPTKGRLDGSLGAQGPIDNALFCDYIVHIAEQSIAEAA
jgi:hypothetical protein